VWEKFPVKQDFCHRENLFTTCDNRIRVWDSRNLSHPIGILAGKHSSSVMCLAAAENVPMNDGVCDVMVSGAKDHYIKVFFKPRTF
jgi:WD40 repeat protein